MNKIEEISSNVLKLKPDLVFIFANWRTGSTFLGQKLHELTGYDYLCEAFHESFDIGSHAEEIDEKGKIIKVMPTQYQKHRDFIVPYLNKNVYKIGLKRRNLLEQIFSFFICFKTGYYHNKDYDNIIFDYDNQELELIIQKIVEENRFLENYLFKMCDIKIAYEDIRHIDVKFEVEKKNKYPLHLLEIKDRIRKLLILCLKLL